MSTTPSSADERALLPCPFCGGAANMDNIGAIFAAGCDACGAEAGWHSTEASAVAGWNQRASLGAAQVPSLSDEQISKVLKLVEKYADAYDKGVNEDPIRASIIAALSQPATAAKDTA